MIIRRLTPETINEQLDLFRSTLSPDRSIDKWIKRFTLNPYTQQYYVYGAIEDNKLIGLNGFIYMRYLLKESVYHVVQSCDSCVHHEFRKQGIFSKIIMTALRDFKNEGMDYAIGFPNQNSYPAFINMGWYEMPRLKSLLLPTEISRTIKDRLSLNVPPIINSIDLLFWRKIKKYSQTNSDIDIISSTDFSSVNFELLSSDFLHLYLSNDFLHWWLKKNNENNYIYYLAKKDNELIAYMIIRENKGKHDLHVEIIAYGKNRETSALDYCAGISKILSTLKYNYSYITVLVQEHAENNIFRKMGMIPIGEGRPIVLYVINDFKKAEIMNPQNWCTKAIELDTIIL